MQEEREEKLTLRSLVDAIEFTKIKKRTSPSETDSLSSSHTMETEKKEKSKIWTKEEIETLESGLRNFGTDFHILSTFFPRKTKNQIKNKSKQIASMRKKQKRAQDLRFQAMTKLFEQVDEKEEEN